MNFLEAGIFLAAAIALYYMLYRKTRDLLNPPGLMIFISLFVAGVSHLNLGAYQTAWSKDTYWSITLSALTMTIAGLIFIKNKRARISSALLKDNMETPRGIPLSRRFHRIYYVWAGICFIAAAWTIIEKGLDLTYVFTVSMDGNKGEWAYSDNMFVEYFAGMLPHISIIAFFEIVFSRYNNKLEKIINMVIIVASLFFTLFVMVSRGTAIIQILGYLYILNRKKRLSFQQFGKLVLAILFLFGAFSLLRWQDPSSATVYSGRLDLPLFNSIYNYIAYCYQNFDSLVRMGSPFTQYKFVFMPITKFMGTYEADDIIYISIAGFNAAPSIFGYYHDLGNFGIALYSMVVIIFLSALYNMSNKNEAFSLVLAMFQKGVFSIFFGDYILQFNGQILPMIITFILIIINRCDSNLGYYSYSSTPRKVYRIVRF